MVTEEGFEGELRKMAAERRSQLPLRGVILCCTSFSPEERNRLARVAEEMGADHRYDLTSDVTHLLVGAIDTPKYKYVAKERPDVRVLKPEWIDAVSEQWMLGNDVDVLRLENIWVAPPFLNLNICLTGFEDLEKRDAISSMVQKHGAQYSGDLTRDITHLITAAPRGKKYEYARGWNIMTVTLQWVSDSIERGLALDEALYDPVLPVEQQGLNAWKRELLPQVLGKRDRSDAQPNHIDNRKRKLRRTASEKLSSQNEAIWADITFPKSEAHGHSHDHGQTSHHTSLARKIQPDTNATEQPGQIGRLRPRAAGVFEGRPVCLSGFDKKKTDILRDALGSHGASVLLASETDSLSSGEQSNGFLVVPHDAPPGDLERQDHLRLQHVTEFWVESCLEQRQLIDPPSTVLCRPLVHNKIEGFEGVVINSTSFEGLSLVHLSKIITLVGATYSEILNDVVSIIISKSDFPLKHQKLEFAVRHNIPIVSFAWFDACLRTGTIQPPLPYIIPAVEETTLGYAEEPAIRKFVLGQRQQKEPSKNDITMPAIIQEAGGQTLIPEKAVTARPMRPPDEVPLKPRQATPHQTEPTLPLQELEPEVNQLSRRSRSVSKSNSLSPYKEASTPASGRSHVLDGVENLAPSVQKDHEDEEHESQPPPAPNMEKPTPEPDYDGSTNLNSAISALLAHKQASRPSSAADASAAINDRAQGNPQRRRNRRFLGRASSTTSTGSGPFSRASSLQTETQNMLQAPGPATQALQQSAMQPSQALVWQDPEVQRDREDLIGRMGGKVTKSHVIEFDTTKVLKDAVDEVGGVGSRVRRRAREGRAGIHDR